MATQQASARVWHALARTDKTRGSRSGYRGFFKKLPGLDVGRNKKPAGAMNGLAGVTAA